MYLFPRLVQQLLIRVWQLLVLLLDLNLVELDLEVLVVGLLRRIHLVFLCVSGGECLDPESHESVLLLQETVLDKLVDQGEDNRMGRCLDGGGRPRGEGHDHTGSQEEEENSRCQKIPHLFVLLCENLPERNNAYSPGNSIRHGPSEW